MDNNDRLKYNIVFGVSLFYIISVYSCVSSDDTFRLYMYRILTVVFMVIPSVFNFYIASGNVSLFFQNAVNKIKELLGYKEEVKKEDKVRTFIE